MTQPEKPSGDSAPITYPWPPHEFIVPRAAFEHLSAPTVEELKALHAAGKITVK